MENNKDISPREELKDLAPFLSQKKKDAAPFEVPADYFEELPMRVQERIATPAQEGWLSMIKSWLSIRNLAIASGLVVAFILVQPYIGVDKKTPTISSDDLMALIDEGVIDFDEDVIYDAYAGTDNIEIETSTNIDEEEIIDYLMDEEVDVEGNYDEL